MLLVTSGKNNMISTVTALQVATVEIENKAQAFWVSKQVYTCKTSAKEKTYR